VLAAALIHAGWNAMLKAGLDPFRLMALIAMCGGAATAPLLLWTGLPPIASWPERRHLASPAFGLYAGPHRGVSDGRFRPASIPWRAAAGAPAHRHRGCVRVPGSDRTLGVAGVILLGGGISLLSFRGHASLSVLSRRSVGFAFATAGFIVAYTVVDGAGGPAAGDTVPYSWSCSCWMGSAWG
jgi:hypothetical protein